MRALKRYQEEKESFRRFSEERDRISAEFRKSADKRHQQFVNDKPTRKRREIPQSPWFDVFRDGKL